MTHSVRLVYLHPYMQIAQISKRNSRNSRIMDLKQSHLIQGLMPVEKNFTTSYRLHANQSKILLRVLIKKGKWLSVYIKLD